MARKTKFDKGIEKAVMKHLDKLTRTYTLTDVKHAATKWCNAQRIRASVEKERKRLADRLAELDQKLA